VIDEASHIPFKRVALIACRDKPEIIDTLVSLKRYLQAQSSQLLESIVLESETACKLQKSDCDIPTVPAESLSQHADLLIVVGGDGSLLQAARIATPQNLPVLGINRGRLGFLTDIPPDDFTVIKDVLAGYYQKETRFLLETCVKPDGQSDAICEIALNDAVISRGEDTRLAEFDIYIDGQFVCHQHADGLIIATPTGSTAYALSGGGPILHPRLNAIVLVPMFPHTLSSRSVVIEGSSVVEVFVSDSTCSELGISCDGQSRAILPAGSHVKVTRHKKVLQLIHPVDYTYFNTLREKLHWEKKQYAHPNSDKKLCTH